MKAGLTLLILLMALTTQSQVKPGLYIYREGAFCAEEVTIKNDSVVFIALGCEGRGSCSYAKYTIAQNGSVTFSPLPPDEAIPLMEPVYASDTLLPALRIESTSWLGDESGFELKYAAGNEELPYDYAFLTQVSNFPGGTTIPVQKDGKYLTAVKVNLPPHFFMYSMRYDPEYAAKMKLRWVSDHFTDGKHVYKHVSD